MHGMAMSSTPPALPRDTPAFDALRARLANALRAHADPQTLLQVALSQLRGSEWQAWQEYARAFSLNGAAPLAIALLVEATRRWPLVAQLQVGLGNALRLSQRLPEAEQAFRNVLRMHPDHAAAALPLAFMLRDSGRIDAACAVVLALWQDQGRGVEATLKAAAFFEECGQPRWVAQVCETGLGEGLCDPRVAALAGDAAVALGQFELGRERLLAALDGGLELKDWSGIFGRLASTQHYADSAHPDLQRFEQAWADLSLAEETRIAAGFALGKARTDIGDFSGAVDVLRQANALRRERSRWDAAAMQDFIAARIAAPLPPQVDAGAAFASVIPIFVVGLPRTGTTLVAQLMARHPHVRSRGEMDWLPFLAFELSAGQHANNAAALRQAASVYLAHLRQDDAPARWYIDKNPHNFRHLDLIASLFPQARIIHCVRERRDTAVSIWSQLFAHQDMDYAYDLGDIAAFGHGHDRLMEHWRRSLTLPLFELAYERLVDQPAAMLRELAAFIGLSEHDLADAQPDDRSAIGTASVWQARQPIHRGAVGRWRQFAPYLPELAEHFGVD